jgi:hypothetical protein
MSRRTHPAAPPPAADPAAQPAPEPTITIPANLAAAVFDFLAQMPSGQAAGLFMAYRQEMLPKLQALQGQAG